MGIAYMHKKTLLQAVGEFFILWIYEWAGVWRELPAVRICGIPADR